MRIKQKYYYQFTRRSTGETLLEGVLEASTNQEAWKLADYEGFHHGLSAYTDDDVKKFVSWKRFPEHMREEMEG